MKPGLKNMFSEEGERGRGVGEHFKELEEKGEQDGPDIWRVEGEVFRDQ